MTEVARWANSRNQIHIFGIVFNSTNALSRSGLVFPEPCFCTHEGAKPHHTQAPKFTLAPHSVKDPSSIVFLVVLNFLPELSPVLWDTFTFVSFLFTLCLQYHPPRPGEPLFPAPPINPCQQRQVPGERERERAQASALLTAIFPRPVLPAQST